MNRRWRIRRMVVLGVLMIGLMPTLQAQTVAKVSKKGVCLTTKNKDWRDKVAALNASWHYSWGLALPEREPMGVEFVPMIWSWNPKNPKHADVLKALSLPRLSSSECLLGFNEPDGKEQANLSVATAIEAWPQLMKTNRRLGSPAAVHADKEWMQQFMKEAEKRKLRVDFVCVHWYGGPNAKSFIDRLRKIHEMYGKPIWITEFAVADWQAESVGKNRHKPEVIQRFMKELLPQLDQLDFIERYAWFTYDDQHPKLGTSALFKADGSMTELGRIYAAHGTAKAAK